MSLVWIHRLESFILKLLNEIIFLVSGGISIAYVQDKNNPHVLMVHPLSGKDLVVRSLGDRMRDLHQCVTLYPNIAKDQVFGNYYSPAIGNF